MEKSESKFQDLYKIKSQIDLQELRRQTLLKEHKLQRALLQDETRNLQDCITKTLRKTEKFAPRARTFKSKYQVEHTLQFSEWLKEKPDDFSEWVLVPCPRGQRCMVIACNGYTEMYNKHGRYVYAFSSLLPGNVGSKNEVTILDCIYVEDKSTFYVLDALAYGNHDLINCEAQFRFFWITSKFMETNFKDITHKNDNSFVCLEFYDFENTSRLTMGLQKYPLWDENFPRLDGFLFYHKESSYACGTTPLVGWLFAFMVPEVLGFPVNSAYMEEKPEGYTDCMRYMLEFDNEMARKKNLYKKRKSERLRMLDDEMSREDEDEGEDNAFLKALLKSQRDLELGGEALNMDEEY